ncbi:MAG: dicarboxylate/amino acid:cation symporter [Bacteroidetes bacterium]|nr:MAG: dicarboxylate/amino acid:cation symporter [Bacteroidota bacterium]
MQKIKKIIKNLGFQIILAMIIGVVVGVIMGPKASIFAPLGNIFISLIKMLVIPLVAISIISGSASLGATKSAGKMGVGTFFYYLLTTAVAVIIGLVMGEIFKPGIGLDINTVKEMFSTQTTTSVSQPSFWEIIISIIPTNPIEALAKGNILQILFFCLFLGIGISTLPITKRTPLVNGCNYLIEALIWMIKIVMYSAPIGVFGLMADSIGTFGYDILSIVMKLFIVYVAAILIHGLIFYPLTLKFFSKISLKKFFSKMWQAQIVAFSTASSMATLPVNMEICETELDVSKETTSFVLPLGATINMDGNAIYYALVAVFFAQMFGIQLGTAQYVAIIITATIGSIGQAGVPGPTLLVVAVLIAADIPIIGLPLLYALDRVFDMIRTALNITGDATCAVIMDRFNVKK